MVETRKRSAWYTEKTCTIKKQGDFIYIYIYYICIMYILYIYYVYVYICIIYICIIYMCVLIYINICNFFQKR